MRSLNLFGSQISQTYETRPYCIIESTFMHRAKQASKKSQKPFLLQIKVKIKA